MVLKALTATLLKLVFPSKVLAECNPKVLCSVNCFQTISIQSLDCFTSGFLDVHMLMTWHFSGRNSICNLVSHSSSASRLHCKASASVLLLICQ